MPKKKIFGHNIFTNKSLTFQASANLATPPNYRPSEDRKG